MRVIADDGTQLGILSREEALAQARQKGLDLVEVAPNVNPPVARLVEFEKFRYKEEKRDQAAKKHARDVELKEVWLSPRIAQHDLEVRLKKTKEFLERGDRVKLTVKFRGREMAHPEVGYEVVKKALGYLGEEIHIERETRFEGRNLTTIISTTKGKVQNENQIKN